MTNPSSSNQLETLLSVLRQVADLVVENPDVLSRDELQPLLKGRGLDKEEWAVSKLEHWADVLTYVRGVTDARKRDIAVHSLVFGNVPEAPARLAVEMVAFAPPKPKTLPIQVSPEGIGFEDLEPGQMAQTTLTVSGGPGRVKVSSDMVTVQPETFGPAETTLTTTPAHPPEVLAGQGRVNPIDDAVMVYIPEGEFIMGSDKSKDNLARNAELPQRKVYLDGYWIYKHEVTVAQYRKFCDETGRQMPKEPSWGWHDNHPIVYVTWNNAVDYCKWAGVQLPTEAQWEKAARGNDERIWPWGDEWDASKCNNGITGPKKITPVGSYPAGASPYGLMDMAGNVWEWCADWYGEKYYVSAPNRNPQGASSGTWRVLRGGSWVIDIPFYFRSARRFWFLPGCGYVGGGFRCVALRIPR